MPFGTQNKIKKTNVQTMKIEGEALEVTTDYKYLGISLDENLNYKKHVKDIIRVASHKTYLHRHVRKYMTKDTIV